VLADDIAADKVLAEGNPGLNVYQEIIQSAQKFSLSHDFAAAADGLIDNVNELKKVMPYCRLPYPICWFEVAQGDRAHFMSAPTHFPADQGAPARVGFLCIAELDDPTDERSYDLASWETYLCWSLKRREIKPVPDGKGGFWVGGSTVHNISALVVSYHMSGTMNALEDKVTFDMVPFKHAMMKQYGHNADHMSRLLHSDWAGEIRFLVSLLGLLNARNVAETEKVDYTRLNRKREKHHKYPLSSHILLKIRTEHKRSLSGPGTGSPAEIRAHFVRGHFKTRKTGIFWWGPHMRGKLEYGYVAKDYQVEV
jgi:hypothetical protein